jgi:hypothetical protein
MGSLGLPLRARVYLLSAFWARCKRQDSLRASATEILLRFRTSQTRASRWNGVCCETLNLVKWIAWLPLAVKNPRAADSSHYSDAYGSFLRKALRRLLDTSLQGL